MVHTHAPLTPGTPEETVTVPMTSSNSNCALIASFSPSWRVLVVMVSSPAIEESANPPKDPVTSFLLCTRSWSRSPIELIKSTVQTQPCEVPVEVAYTETSSK